MTEKNRETLKLLNISDNESGNKNSEDSIIVDMPEILQRPRRKIRRKHRQRSSTSVNNHQFNFNERKMQKCSNVLILWFIFILLCWLISLTYIFSVIYSDNMRLKLQIKKLEGSTLNLPEMLQTMHENFKLLENNQTYLLNKILNNKKINRNLQFCKM